jgi:hypothetical protein
MSRIIHAAIRRCFIAILIPVCVAYPAYKVTQGTAQYYEKCGCNRSIYFNSFEYATLDEKFLPGTKVTDVFYPNGGNSYKIHNSAGTGPGCLTFSPNSIDRFNCFMPGNVSKLTGYFLTSHGRTAEFYATYSTTRRPGVVIPLEIIQKFGQNGTWRSFEYYFDFEQFEINEKLTSLQLYARAPDNGAQALYVDELSICSFCDDEIRESPEFEVLAIVDNAGTVIKNLDPSKSVQTITVPRSVSAVKLKFKIPAVGIPDPFVEVHSATVSVSPGAEIIYPKQFITNDYLPVAINVSLRDGPVSGCKYAMYRIMLVPEKKQVALLTGIVITPNGEILKGFSPTVFEYDATIPPGTTAIQIKPISDYSYVSVFLPDFGNQKVPLNQFSSALSIPGGTGTIVLNVSAPDGTQNVYTIQVTDFYAYFCPEDPTSGMENVANPPLFVCLSKPAPKHIVVQFFNAGGSAIEGVDYDELPYDCVSASFDLNETKKPLEAFSLIDNNTKNGTRTVIFKGKDNSDVVFPNEEFTFAILDDELYSVGFVDNHIYVNESAQPTNKAMASIDEYPATSFAKAKVTVVPGVGTAVKGIDFNIPDPVLAWGNCASCPNAQNIPIQTIGNDDVGPNKTFELQLKPVDNVAIGALNSAEVTIVDDDKFTITIAEPAVQTVTEPTDASITVPYTVRINQPVGAGEGPVRVNLRVVPELTQATAGVGGDYAFGQSFFEWTQGTPVEQTTYITIYPDAVLENEEAVYFTMSDVLGAKTDGVGRTLKIMDAFTGRLYVDKKLTTGANDGLSWGSAFRGSDALEKALVEADSRNPGSGNEIEIWVAQANPGQPYLPSAEREKDIARSKSFRLRSYVKLYGGFAGTGTETFADRNVVLNETILSGDFLLDDEADYVNYDENAYSVVIGADNAVIDGFTIEHGCADDYWGNAWGSHYFGAGMANFSVAPSVRNCTFIDNFAYYRIDYDGGGYLLAGEGAAIYNQGANPIIENCDFIGNFAVSGGGILNEDASPTVSNCYFYGNEARGSGGGIYNSGSGGSSPNILGCVFIVNSSLRGGGAVGNEYSSPIILNCTMQNINGGGCIRSDIDFKFLGFPHSNCQ